MTYLDSVPAANDPGLAIWPIEERGPEQVAMRQLRHHTKNALQRLLCQVSSCRGLQQDTAGRALAADLERRIRLSADLSDALFGLTRAPLPLPGRLSGLVRAAVDMMSDGDQIITVEVTVDDDCGGPALDGLGDLITRVTHELVGNAVKHGMHVRMVGRIAVRVRMAGDQAVLTVSDDGWGLGEAPARGEGLRIGHLLAEQHGGRLRLFRAAGQTVAEMAVPLDQDR